VKIVEKSNHFGTPVFSLTREYLAKLRLKARRNGAWFRDLKQNERSLLDLTINIVKKVRSFRLAQVVSRLVSRLYETLESRIYYLISTVGREMAKNVSRIGEELGYQAAKNWVSDRTFMQFLVVNNLGVLGK
jgi:hypothetical protein